MAKTIFIRPGELNALLSDGMSLMVGGLHTVGTPAGLIEQIIQSGVKDLVVICGDGGFPDQGVGRLLHKGRQNIRYRGSAKNFNPLMAQAADVTVFEVEHIVPAGEIGPDHVDTPHILADYVVKPSGSGSANP